MSFGIDADDHRRLGADRLLVVLELSQPQRLPGLGLLRLPDDGAAARARRSAHALQQVGAVHALRHRHDLVERERGPEQRLEAHLQSFALELHRAALELALELGGLALGGLELDLVLRVDAPALLVELPLVVDVAVLVRLLELAQAPAEAELLVAELGKCPLLLGDELALQGLLLLRQGALELLGVALDGLARQAVRQREVVAALRAGDLRPAVDHDGSHGGMVNRAVAQGVSYLSQNWGLTPISDFL